MLQTQLAKMGDPSDLQHITRAFEVQDIGDIDILELVINISIELEETKVMIYYPQSSYN